MMLVVTIERPRSDVCIPCWFHTFVFRFRLVGCLSVVHTYRYSYWAAPYEIRSRTSVVLLLLGRTNSGLFGKYFKFRNGTEGLEMALKHTCK